MKDNGIQPGKSNGDKVKIKIRGEVIEGKILNTYRDKAVYVVNTDPKENGGYLINFEDLIQ